MNPSYDTSHHVYSISKESTHLSTTQKSHDSRDSNWHIEYNIFQILTNALVVFSTCGNILVIHKLFHIQCVSQNGLYLFSEPIQNTYEKIETYRAHTKDV